MDWVKSDLSSQASKTHFIISHVLWFTLCPIFFGLFFRKQERCIRQPQWPPQTVTDGPEVGAGWVFWGRVGRPNSPINPISAINLLTWVPLLLILTPHSPHTRTHTPCPLVSHSLCWVYLATAPHASPLLHFWWMDFNKSWQSDEIKSASHGLQLLRLLNYSTYFNIVFLKLEASVLHHCSADIIELLIAWLDCCC